MRIDLSSEGCLAAARPQVASRAAAGLTRLIAMMRCMAAEQRSVLSDLFVSASSMQPWTHWPAGDACDSRGGFRWYYHSHGRASRVEHGHFHLFAENGRRGVTHLVGVAVDALGQPRSIFTANRWVTDEVWRPAPAVLSLIARFRLRTPRAHARMHRWLRAVLDAFEPQLRSLLHHRDLRIASLGAGDRQVLEDRRVFVLSRCSISIDSQARALDRILSHRA